MVDNTDLKIINILSGDSRKSFVDIAGELNISDATVYNRITKLKKTGIIKGFTIDVDKIKMGKLLPTVININLIARDRSKIIQQLLKKEEITSMYRLAGANNIVVFADFENIQHMKNFIDNYLSSFEGIQDYKVSVISEKIK